MSASGKRKGQAAVRCLCGRLFQREEKLRDRLMLWHFREEGEALAIERKVPWFLTAGR